MNKNKINVDVVLNGIGGLIKTDEGQHPFTSRLFVNDQWRAVACQDQKSTSYLPLEIKWTRKRIAPEWVSLKAQLTNQGRVPVRLGAFHMMEGGNLGTDAADPVVFLDSAGGWFAGAVKGKASCPPYMEKWENYFIAAEDIDWAKERMGGNLEAGAHHSPAGLMVYHRGEGFPAWMLSFVVPMKRCSSIRVSPGNRK